MKTLQEYISNLPEKSQFKIALEFTKLALPIWQDYKTKNDLTYRDSVVGLTHKVDGNLLANAIFVVEEYLHSNKSKELLLKTRAEFDDPIVSLQDTDWELPAAVEETFYAVFNLVEACLGKVKTSFGDLTIYVSISQAIAALELSKSLNYEEVMKLLYDRKDSL